MKPRRMPVGLDGRLSRSFHASASRLVITETDERYATTQPARSVTLADLTRYGHPPILADALIESAEMTRRELPHRLARRVRAHYGLPYLPASNPMLSQVCDTYRRGLETIEGIPPIKTLKDNANFVTKLEEMVQSASEVIPMLAKGFRETQRYLSEDQISTFLDRAIRNRIAIRLIAEQHIALSVDTERIENGKAKRDESMIGLVDLKLEVKRIIESVGKFVTDLCEATYGQAPEYRIDGEVDVEVAYVGMHLEYILTELMKNAFRATVEHHRAVTGSSSPDLPPVLITLSTITSPSPPPASSSPAKPVERPRTFSPSMYATSTPPPRPTSKSTLSIRVRDSGGGIPPKHLKDVFSYAFTTVGKPDPADQDEGVGSSSDEGGGMYDTMSGTGSLTATANQTGLGTLAGLGYGLPMARTYCRYFGGQLDLSSIPGKGGGVDAYVVVPLLTFPSS